MKIHSGHIEVAVAELLNYRQNLIVPNVSWGLGFLYELDMVVVMKSGWVYEVEIKTSISDLKADFKKKHYHDSKKIRGFYYAVPESMEEKTLELIPEQSGLITVSYNMICHTYDADRKRWPKLNKAARKFTEREITKLGKLGCMRIWSLKNHLYQRG